MGGSCLQTPAEHEPAHRATPPMDMPYGRGPSHNVYKDSDSDPDTPYTIKEDYAQYTIREGFSPSVASRRGRAGVRRVDACTGGEDKYRGEGAAVPPPSGSTRTPGSSGMAGIRDGKVVCN